MHPMTVASCRNDPTGSEKACGDGSGGQAARARVFREEEPGAHPKAHSTAAPKDDPEGCPSGQLLGPGGRPPEQPVLLTPLCQRRAFAVLDCLLSPAHHTIYEAVHGPTPVS
jgi:hypothetical protein